MRTRYQRLEVKVHLAVLLDYFIDHPTCFLVLLKASLDENVSEVRVRDLLLSNLDSCSTFKLERPYSVSAFPDYQTYTLIRHRYDVGVRARWTIWCQQMILDGH